MDTLHDILRIALIGFGATAVMDVWLKLLKRMGVATQSFSLIGRWVGHLLRGQWAHQAISKAEPIPGEMALGWLSHYAVGAAFAALLAMVVDPGWMTRPTLPPALAVGMLTVAAPLLVMQPAMGAGIFASKTPSPLKSCIRSLLNHSVFGVGLFLTASLIAHIQF